MAKKAARRAKNNNGRTSSQKKKAKRLQHYNNTPTLAHRVKIDGWDEKKSLRANYRHLGIAHDSNDIFKSPNQSYEESQDQLLPSRTGVMTARLDYLQSLPPPEVREVKSMNVQEQYQLQALIKKYSDDYEGMQSDLKLNVQQMTATKLQNRIELMFRLQQAAGVFRVSTDATEANNRIDESDLEMEDEDEEEIEQDGDFEAELERRFKREESERKAAYRADRLRFARKQKENDKSVNAKLRGLAKPNIVVPTLKQLVKTRVYSARSREKATEAKYKNEQE